jgi:hypothetical protein
MQQHMVRTMTAELQRGVARGGRAARRAAGLALLLALGACAQAQGPSFPSSPFGRLSFGPNWGGERPVVSAERPTVQRVRGTQTARPEPLQPEEGTIWPAREAPRATLADPEEALRGAPPRGSSTSPDILDPPRPGTRGIPRLPALDGPPPAPPISQQPVSQQPFSQRPLSQRTDGQVIPTPGGPAVTTGGAGNVRTITSPQGGGIAIQEGPTTTILTPGLPPRQVPTPR